MQVRVLGPVECWGNNRRLSLGAPKQRALIARLAMAVGQPVAADRLAADIWHRDAPSNAPELLQVCVSKVRRVLEPDRAPRASARVLVSRSPGYALIADVDATRFAACAAAGAAAVTAAVTAADFVHAASELDEALGLWHGETAYADVADEPWASAEVARLAELRLVTQEQRLAVAVEVGEAPAAVAALEPMVAAHPLREGLWRLLALALYRTSRQADALAVLRRARAVFAEELGLDVGPELRKLEAEILSQSPQLLVEPRAVHPRRSISHHRAFGRGEDLAALARLAEEARSQALPRIAVVSGEPGIGKTLVAEASAESLAAEGWRIAWGRCHDASGAPALWPFLQVLEELAPGLEPPSEVTRLQTGNSRQGGDAAAARFAQHRAVAGYLSQVARTQPLAIVLDDLQWADGESVALLAALPALVRSARLMIIAVRRAGEGGELLDHAIAALSRHGVLRVQLGGLSAAATAELVQESALRVDPTDLARRTGGNPFLLRETLRVVALHGPESILHHVPAAAADLLHQRFAELPPPVVDVLRAAAVVGTPMSPGLVVAASGAGPDSVVDALDAAAGIGLVVVDDRITPAFAHDLIRETLYADVPPLRRAAMHGRVLAELERSGTADANALAVHAAAAGPEHVRAALRWSVAAAEQATARYAYDDAVRWWRVALDTQNAADPGDFAAQVELMLRSVRAQLDAGDAVAAERTRDAAVLAADHVADPLLRMRALVPLDRPALWTVRHYNRVDDLLVHRLEVALRSGDAPAMLRVRLLATLANELTYGGDRKRRAELAAAAVALADGTGEPHALAFALGARYLSLDADPREWDESAAKIGGRLLELGERHELPSYSLIGYLILGLCNTHTFDLAAADACAVAAERLNHQLHQPLPALQLLTWRANRAVLARDFATAERLMDEVGDTAVEWWAIRGITAVMRLLLLLNADRIDEAAPLIDAIAPIHPAMAHDAGVLLGRRPQSSWPAIPADWLWSAASVVRAAAALAVADSAACRTVYSALQPAAGRVLVTGTADGGPADYWLGLLADALGDAPAADEHFTRLAESATAAGLPQWRDRARSAVRRR